MQRDLFERERLILMKRNYSKKITRHIKRLLRSKYYRQGGFKNS